MGVAGFARRRPWLIVVATLILVGVSVLGARRLVEEEDVLVFLPAHNADVARFRDVSKRFGSLKVVLIGVEVADRASDVFSPTAMARIVAASRALRDTPGVDRVVSLSTLPDVVAGEMGAEITQLVPDPPASVEESKTLRTKVMSRDHVVGNYVSKDGRAALILLFLAEGVSTRALVPRIREIATRTLAPDAVYFGGAPFAGEVIYGEAQADVRRLSPIALLVLFLVVLWSFREPVGIALTLGTVAISTVAVLGAMGFLGSHFTVATATLPVILFASGSSYAIHVLGRYYFERRRYEADEALSRAVAIVAPPLGLAALTTAAGFFSFLVTDVPPMRAFGIACGMGVLLCWLSSVTLVPAVLALWPRPPGDERRLGWMGTHLTWLWRVASRRRVLVISASLLLFALCIVPMLRVEVHMEPSAFFRAGSEPWKAERFLAERFGGAHFVQVEIAGDLADPATLREVARMEEFARTLPGVSQVLSVAGPMRIVSAAMGNGKRLPSTRAQAANLFFFLEGEAGMSALIDEKREHALVHVRLSGSAHEVVRALEGYAKERGVKATAAPSRDDVATRVAWYAQIRGRSIPASRISHSTRVLTLPSDNDLELAPKMRAIVEHALAEPNAPILSLGQALTALSEKQALEGDAALWLSGVRSDVENARRAIGVAHATGIVALAAGLSSMDKVIAAELSPIVDDLFSDLAAPPKPIAFRVAGEPVLDRGFSRSVADNQLKSLGVSIVVVLMLLYWLFRSPRLALVCWFPALLTLAIVFAVMGLLHIHVDLGTSMVAGIATGAGSDFAMHYLWYLRSESPEQVARTVGPVMIVGVLIVGLGFFVLALGRSPVMLVFGTLTGASMILSAWLACLLIPAFINKVQA